MKNYFIATIGLSILSACSLIENKVKSTFTETNLLFTDSARTLALQNRVLLDSINAQPSTDYIIDHLKSVYFEIHKINQLIDSAQKLISSEIKSSDDKTTPIKYLIRKGLAEEIQQKSVRTKCKISKNSIDTKFYESTIDRIEPVLSDTDADHSQILEIVDSVPAYASLALLTSWRLENERCTELMLSKTLAELEKAGMVKNKIEDFTEEL